MVTSIPGGKHVGEPIDGTPTLDAKRFTMEPWFLGKTDQTQGCGGNGIDAEHHPVAALRGPLDDSRSGAPSGNAPAPCTDRGVLSTPDY
jgi:hypothetical protein